jgi:hypothetical protein
MTTKALVDIARVPIELHRRELGAGGQA